MRSCYAFNFKFKKWFLLFSLTFDYIYLLLTLSYIFFLVRQRGTSQKTPQRVSTPSNDTNFSLQIHQKLQRRSFFVNLSKRSELAWVEYENFYILVNEVVGKIEAYIWPNLICTTWLVSEAVGKSNNWIGYLSINWLNFQSVVFLTINDEFT